MRSNLESRPEVSQRKLWAGIVGCSVVAALLAGIVSGNGAVAAPLIAGMCVMLVWVAYLLDLLGGNPTWSRAIRGWWIALGLATTSFAIVASFAAAATERTLWEALGVLPAGALLVGVVYASTRPST